MPPLPSSFSVHLSASDVALYLFAHACSQGMCTRGSGPKAESMAWAFSSMSWARYIRESSPTVS